MKTARVMVLAVFLFFSILNLKFNVKANGENYLIYFDFSTSALPMDNGGSLPFSIPSIYGKAVWHDYSTFGSYELRNTDPNVNIPIMADDYGAKIYKTNNATFRVKFKPASNQGDFEDQTADNPRTVVVFGYRSGAGMQVSLGLFLKNWASSYEIYFHTRLFTSSSDADFGYIERQFKLPFEAQSGYWCDVAMSIYNNTLYFIDYSGAEPVAIGKYVIGNYYFGLYMDDWGWGNGEGAIGGIPTGLGFINWEYKGEVAYVRLYSSAQDYGYVEPFLLWYHFDEPAGSYNFTDSSGSSTAYSKTNVFSGGSGKYGLGLKKILPTSNDVIASFSVFSYFVKITPSTSSYFSYFQTQGSFSASFWLYYDTSDTYSTSMVNIGYLIFGAWYYTGRKYKIAYPTSNAYVDLITGTIPSQLYNKWTFWTLNYSAGTINLKVYNASFYCHISASTTYTISSSNIHNGNFMGLCGNVGTDYYYLGIEELKVVKGLWHYSKLYLSTFSPYENNTEVTGVFPQYPQGMFLPIEAEVEPTNVTVQKINLTPYTHKLRVIQAPNGTYYFTVSNSSRSMLGNYFYFPYPVCMQIYTVYRGDPPLEWVYLVEPTSNVSKLPLGTYYYTLEFYRVVNGTWVLSLYWNIEVNLVYRISRDGVFAPQDKYSIELLNQTVYHDFNISTVRYIMAEATFHDDLPYKWFVSGIELEPPEGDEEANAIAESIIYNNVLKMVYDVYDMEEGTGTYNLVHVYPLDTKTKNLLLKRGVTTAFDLTILLKSTYDNKDFALYGSLIVLVNKSAPVGEEKIYISFVPQTLQGEIETLQPFRLKVWSTSSVDDSFTWGWQVPVAKYSPEYPLLTNLPNILYSGIEYTGDIKIPSVPCSVSCTFYVYSASRPNLYNSTSVTVIATPSTEMFTVRIYPTSEISLVWGQFYNFKVTVVSNDQKERTYYCKVVNPNTLLTTEPKGTYTVGYGSQLEYLFKVQLTSLQEALTHPSLPETMSIELLHYVYEDGSYYNVSKSITIKIAEKSKQEWRQSGGGIGGAGGISIGNETYFSGGAEIPKETYAIGGTFASLISTMSTMTGIPVVGVNMLFGLILLLIPILVLAKVGVSSGLVYTIVSFIMLFITCTLGLLPFWLMVVGVIAIIGLASGQVIKFVRGEKEE